MNIFDTTAGAKFVRADLHIHSFGEGGSFDVKDSLMTPESIVDTAIEKGLSVISITDHNEVGNVKAAVDHASGKDILVIPGVEIATTQGHLLVYFEKVSEAVTFRGKLAISDDKTICTQGICECLSLAATLGGVGILAHIELDSGFEKTINRFGPQMEAVFTHTSLMGLEITKKDSSIFYTDKDENANRRALVAKRREKLSLETDMDLAKIMSSDSHKLSALGKNADGENRLTRIKMDALDFASFKIALMCPVSRVRLEDMVQERIPRFLGISIDGGLLDGQATRFSGNLTCIIGGRGAGKSTLLESLMACSGNPSESKVINSDVWPQEITLVHEDETGVVTNLSLQKFSEVVNRDDPVDGVCRLPIEKYGQGETAETIQHSDENPQVLIDFLDGFVDLEAIKIEEDGVRSELLSNQSALRKCRTEVAAIPEIRRQKINLEAKLEKLKEENVADLVNYQTSLLKERDLRRNLIDDLKRLRDRYQDILADTSVFDTFDGLIDADIVVGKEYFQKVKALVADFAAVVAKKSEELNESLKGRLAALANEISGWAEKEKDIQAKIDLKKAELAAQNIPFDLGKINSITNDVLQFDKQLKRLALRQQDLTELVEGRVELVNKRLELKNKIYYKRHAFADKVNENLKNSVDGFLVSVKFNQGTFSPYFVDEIKNLMGWRTARVPKADALAAHLSPMSFAAAAKKNNLGLLAAVVDDENKRVFSDDDIAEILLKLRENETYEDFESTKFEDRPSLTVTKRVLVENGEEKFISRRLAQLSLGQQQSILLAILLQSKSTAPLLIDQPEDNLDSEFIYKTIVANLRRIKENRQVIIVTHNPNIAVLGDAELILPLKSSNVKSVIVERGSIDRQETRNLCCDILEGGRAAFNRRKEIYGI